MSKPFSLSVVLSKYHLLVAVFLLIFLQSIHGQVTSLPSRADSIAQTVHQRSYRNILNGIKEPNYVGYVFHNQKPPLIFEADLSPDFNFGVAKNFFILFHFTTDIRMLNDSSAPIKTPSYNPSFTLNYFFNHHATEYENEPVSMITLRIAHYSNGQQGNFFNIDSSINFNNGNFSTNYIELGNTMSKSFADFDGKSKTWGAMSALIRHDLHIRSGTFATEEGLVNSYGFNRLKINMRLFRNLNHVFPNEKEWNLMGGCDLNYILDPKNKLQFFGMNSFQRRFSLRLMAELILPTNRSDFGLFTQFFWGPDYYNIRYSTHYSQFLIGFTAEPVKFFIPHNVGSNVPGKN